MSTLYTVDEIAAQLRLHPLTVYRAVKDGRLEAFRIGRSIRITPDALEAFIQVPRGRWPKTTPQHAEA